MCHVTPLANTRSVPHVTKYPQRYNGVLVLPDGSPLLLENAVATVARSLHPIPRRCRVAVWNVPAPVSFCLSLALERVDAIAIWCNDRWTNAETMHVVRRTRAALLLHGDSVDVYNAPCVTAQMAHIGALDVNWNELRKELHTVHDDDAQLHALYFTSGSTARPKAVRLSKEAMLVQAHAKLQHVGFDSSTVYLHLAPHFHLGGASSALAVALAGGVHVFMKPNTSIMQEANLILDIIHSFMVDALVLVPTVLRVLLDAATRPFPHVRTILYGGSSVSANLIKDTLRTFPSADIIGAYGMTETASSMSFLHHRQLPANSPLQSTAGRPPLHVQLAVDASAPEQVGQIITRGPHVMLGYETSPRCDEAFDDGWLCTGDIGYVTRSGYLVLVGRIKDMIKTGGENVFAREVELTLRGHPAVKETAVVGVPHRTLGEAVAAAVVIHQRHALDKALNVHLRSWCKARLSPFKCPKWIVRFNELPTDALGKVVKTVVKGKLVHCLAAQRRPLRAKL